MEHSNNSHITYTINTANLQSKRLKLRNSHNNTFIAFLKVTIKILRTGM